MAQDNSLVQQNIDQPIGELLSDRYLSYALSPIMSRSLPDVRTVHTTSGRFDLIVGIEAATTEALDDTLDRIGETRGVKGSESLIQLSTKLDRRA